MFFLLNLFISYLFVIMPNMLAFKRPISHWHLWRNKITTSHQIWHDMWSSFVLICWYYLKHRSRKLSSYHECVKSDTWFRDVEAWKEVSALTRYYMWLVLLYLPSSLLVLWQNTCCIVVDMLHVTWNAFNAVVAIYLLEAF